ncbi:MAG: hypothetical protein WBB01_14200 [Phormidesmis sp.]
MISEVRTQATVQPGGIVAVRSDKLPEGATVEVVVLIDSNQVESKPKKKLVDFIGAAKGSFANADEVDAYIREERDSWES